MRPVRKKPYQEHNFALHIPLELDDDGLDFLKLKHLFLIMLASTCLMKTSPNTPPCRNMGEPCLALSSWVHCTILTSLFAHWLAQHCTSSSFSIMMISWEWTWELTPYYSSRHTLYRLNSLMIILRITPWITPWSWNNLLYFHRLTTLKPTYGSSIVYG
jgi:hypothetical protein